MTGENMTDTTDEAARLQERAAASLAHFVTVDVG